MPKFEPTSSSELDAVLSNFRNNIFLPAHLSKQDAELVYAKKHQREIETTPHIVDIAGEQFRLQHIDRTKDLENQHKGLNKILKNMQKSDWNIFPGLLEGLHSADRNVPDAFLEKAIRMAARAGRLDVIVESVRRVARTNFALNSRSRAAHLMWWIQYQALEDGFSANKTAHVLRQAEQIAALLEDEKHAGAKLHASDPRTAPEVTGILLELAAANAKAQNNKDADGEVEKYASRFIATIQKKELEGFLAATKTEFSISNSALITVAPIRYGVKVAIQVLEEKKTAGETAEQLKAILEGLDAQIKQYVEVARSKKSENPPLGLWCYEKTEELLA